MAQGIVFNNRSERQPPAAHRHKRAFSPWLMPVMPLVVIGLLITSQSQGRCVAGDTAPNHEIMSYLITINSPLHGETIWTKGSGEKVRVKASATAKIVYCIAAADEALRVAAQIELSLDRGRVLERDDFPIPPNSVKTRTWEEDLMVIVDLGAGSYSAKTEITLDADAFGGNFYSEEGSIDFLIREKGACCEEGICKQTLKETECASRSGARYLGDGTRCAGDVNNDGIDDACK